MVLAIVTLTLFSLVAFAPVSLAAYTNACSPTNHIGAHLVRSNFSAYHAVRATVVESQVIATCTGNSAGSKSASLVFPANIASSGMLAQLGYGRLASGDPVGFIWTPSDHSNPLGVVTHLTFNHSFQWHHQYRFTIQEYLSGYWEYIIEDFTDGWVHIETTARTATATEVHYLYEEYNRWDVFGGEGSTNEVTMTPLEYKYNSSTQWTTLTGDTSVIWDCWSSCPEPRPWYVHAVASSFQGAPSSLSAWTDSH